MGSMRRRSELRTDEQRIGKAQCRGKSQQGRHEKESFSEAKWVNTDKNHSGYGYYSTAYAKSERAVPAGRSGES